MNVKLLLLLALVGLVASQKRETPRRRKMEKICSNTRGNLCRRAVNQCWGKKPRQDEIELQTARAERNSALHQCLVDNGLQPQATEDPEGRTKTWKIIKDLRETDPAKAEGAACCFGHKTGWLDENFNKNFTFFEEEMSKRITENPIVLNMTLEAFHTCTLEVCDVPGLKNCVLKTCVDEYSAHERSERRKKNKAKKRTE